MARCAPSSGAGGGFGRATTTLAAWRLTELGRLADARRLLAGIDPTAQLPDDFLLLCLSALALHACASVGDVAAAAVLAERLEPYRGRWTQAGSGPIAAGLVDHALARAAAARNDHGAARSCFEAAVAGHERLGVPAWLARSLRDQAAFLAATGRRDDLDAARGALRRSRSIATEHDLVPIVGRVDELADRL